MKKMKLISNTVILLLLPFCKIQAQEGQVTVHAVDENGMAVSNAQAVAQFQNALKPGEGWGTGRPTEVRGTTDTSGFCILAGNGTDGSVSIGILKEGYYYGNAELLFTNGDRILNHWLPWNPMVEVIIQKKGIQVPMYARRVNEIKMPIEGNAAGFDLMAGDWVAPYGKGEQSDFLFKFDSKPETKAPPREFPPYDVTWIVGFQNDGDGIQPAAPLPHGFRVARQAPADGYEPELAKHSYKEPGQPAHVDFLDGQSYFFRVRTKKDAQGKINSALYGKISGDFRMGITGTLTFTYYLNPESNSRNMEFDPKQNLSKNLKSMEGVNVP
jgi:hypothetical protein